MKVFTKIGYYVSVIVLAILLMDACPDFSDNYDDNKTEHACSFTDINSIAHFILSEVLNSHHNSKAHHCNGECNHSFEVDVFMPAETFAFQPLLKVQQKKIYLRNYHSLNQIDLDVNPMPPASLC
jgi:hypothetical protein